MNQQDSLVPWNRYGLIVSIAQAMQDSGLELGKTALQKLTYLLQVTEQADCGYRFAFHNHGPFSPDLAGDLDYLNAIGAVRVAFRQSGQRGFRIEPGEARDAILKHAHGLVEQTQIQIRKVVQEFGKLTVAQLELQSSIVFLYRDSQRDGGELTEDQMVEKVRGVKPQFSEDEIRAAMRELKERGVLGAADCLVDVIAERG